MKFIPKLRSEYRESSFIKVILCLLFGIAASSFLMAEEAELTRYVIDRVDIEVDGRKSEYLLQKELEINEGDTLFGESEFEAYIADKRQLLINQRSLDEESTLDYRLISEGDGQYAVLLIIHAKDSWNIIALPYFRYDSNEGLLLSVRTRDYNFFGTLQTLSLNLNYEREGFSAADPAEYGMEVDFTLPFQAVERDWTWTQQFDLKYVFEEPLYFNTDSGLSITLPSRFLAFDNDYRDYQLTFSHNYYLNNDGEEDEDGWFFNSGVEYSTTFETPINLGLLGRLVYGPSVFTELSYKPGSLLSEDRRGVESGFSHSLSAGRINWKGNFRDGQEVSLSNSNTYNWYTGGWPIIITAESQFHRSLGFAGFSSRLYGFKMFNDARSDPGGPIRGILDNRVADSDAGAYVNMDFPIKMWIWFMSRWFEAHLSPFFDAAVVKPTDRAFEPGQDIWYSAGLEAFSFAKFSRALYLRISFGVDLEAFFDDYRLMGDSPRDEKPRYSIFIGLGHHY